MERNLRKEAKNLKKKNGLGEGDFPSLEILNLLKASNCGTVGFSPEDPREQE